MKINITETSIFIKKTSRFLRKRKLLQKDLDTFVDDLLKDLDQGDVITGTGGVRKIRLRSATSGKSGGFRICYYYNESRYTLYFITIYDKSEQSNITAQEKAEFKEFIHVIKNQKEK
jgi:hypothetical protein